MNKEKSKKGNSCFKTMVVLKTNIEAHNSLATYLNYFKNCKLLSEEEEKELGIKIANGNNRAKTELINRNYRLVVSIANNYAAYGADLIDLIQAGNLGLTTAAEKWDVTKGTRFSTYATYLIKKEIYDFLESNHCYRIPQKVYARYKEIRDFENQYFLTFGVEPNNEQLATFSKKYSEKEIEKLKSYIPSEISLNTKLDEDGETEILDTIQCDENSAAEEIDKEIQNSVLIILLSQLTENERNVYMWRNGLGIDEPMTLEEIGKILKVTKERVRQIENKARLKIETYVKKHDNFNK